MARRLFRGRAFSENGWPYVDQGSCTWVRIPGAEHVSLQIQNGPPLLILRAFAADYHAFVEPLRDADSACWTPDNSVDTSNHPGGTSADLNWNGPDGRTFRYGISKERAFPGRMAQELDQLYAFYEDIVFCGGYWSIRDWMHHQLKAGTYDQKNDRPTERVLDFIRRKIRPDGFSTYRRGGTPAQPPPPVQISAVDVLSRAADVPASRAAEILPDVSEALKLCGCNNPRRIAAALAQWIIESGHFVYTEEIASGPESEERWKYKGRTWIQLTWLENYAGFSKWVHGLGLVPTPDYFVARPKELAQLRWRALGPAYWWAIKYPRINEYADRGDIDNVSKWVNAPAWVDNPNRHANHEAERRAAYHRALALGDQLLALVGEPPVELDEWEALMASNETYSSRSPYRDSNDKKMRPIDALFGADGMAHAERVESAARRGESWAIERVARTAAGQGAGATVWFDPSKRDDWAVQHAQAVLAEIEALQPELLRAYILSKGPQ